MDCPITFITHGALKGDHRKKTKAELLKRGLKLH